MNKKFFFNPGAKQCYGVFGVTESIFSWIKYIVTTTGCVALNTFW